MANTELLQQVMQHIKDNPTQHNQEDWVSGCGTAACFAGWAVILGQGKNLDYLYNGVYHDDLDVYETAVNLLEIPHVQAHQLFYGDNSQPMLELMVKDLVNGDGLRPREDYRTATGYKGL